MAAKKKVEKLSLPEGFRPAPSQGAEQGPGPVWRSRNPTPLKGAKKGAQTRLTRQRTAQREEFENSDEVGRNGAMVTVSGRQRMTPPPMLETNVAGPVTPEDAARGRSVPAYVNPRRHYAEMGWHDNSSQHENQATLPGMESLAEGRRTGLVSSHAGGTTLPDTVPVPEWKHQTNAEKLSVEAHAARFGVTRASAKAAFAANLDQAFHNAHQAGTTPHARDFYVDDSPDMPRGHITEASRASGRSVSSIATATSQTSPQTEWGPTKEGYYPNIRAARHAAMADPNAPLTKKGIGHPTLADDDPRKVGTFTGNVVKAAGAVRQQESGTLAADLRGAPTKSNPQGNLLFGTGKTQKTTAFRNALVDPEGPEASFVSDVHSGGRGMAPHLTPEQAGAYLKHPGIHQWHDDIAREVMRERGLQSVNNTQAAQWGQAQIDSGQVKAEDAYKKPPKLHPVEHPGQGAFDF